MLLTQRKPGTHLGDLWEFPGGKVEPGEDPRLALARELREEIGIEAEIGEIVEVTFHVYRHSVPDSKPPAGVPQSERAVLLLFFEARQKAGSPPPRALDVAALQWASPAELAQLSLPAADEAVLAKVRRRLGGS